MATVIITPEMQRANAEALLGKDPGKFRDPGQKWTAARRAEKVRELKQTEAEKPVTVLNLNCFPLKINGGVYFPDEVPACKLGEPYAIHVIRHTRWGHKDLGCDAQNMMQMEPVPAIPMVQAAEYMREFAQQDGGFGGVLCYVGDQDPAKIKPGTMVRVPEVRYDENGEFYIEVQERDFHSVLSAVKSKRNASLMRGIQSANSWYENESQRMNVDDKHRDMARVALAEGLIKELPRWVLQANPEEQKKADPCPQCASIPNTGATICTNCGHIFDVIAAYRNTRIAYGAVEMDRLTTEEWKVVKKIKAERDEAKKSANA